MVVTLVIAVLAAIAYPQYQNYVLRAKIAEGTAGLLTLQAQMERYYQNHRTYANKSETVKSPCALAPKAGEFDLACSGTPTASAYTIKAEGRGFTFTVNQQNTRTTEGAWGDCATAWILSKGQGC